MSGDQLVGAELSAGLLELRVRPFSERCIRAQELNTRSAKLWSLEANLKSANLLSNIKMS